MLPLYSVAYSAGSLITLIMRNQFYICALSIPENKVWGICIVGKRANEVLIFVGAMLAGIMIFQQRNCSLIFGGMKYIESVDVLIPILGRHFFNYTFQLFARVQEYYERKLMVVIPSILCAVPQPGIELYLINLSLVTRAAAYTTFFLLCIFCLLHYFFL